MGAREWTGWASCLIPTLRRAAASASEKRWVMEKMKSKASWLEVALRHVGEIPDAAFRHDGSVALVGCPRPGSKGTWSCCDAQVLLVCLLDDEVAVWPSS